MATEGWLDVSSVEATDLAEQFDDRRAMIDDIAAEAKASAA